MSDHRWYHRRKMAWRAFYMGSGVAGLVTSVLVFGSVERIQAMGNAGVLILGLLGFFGGIVMAYIGGAVVDDNWKK